MKESFYQKQNVPLSTNICLGSQNFFYAGASGIKYNFYVYEGKRCTESDKDFG